MSRAQHFRMFVRTFLSLFLILLAGVVHADRLYITDDATGGDCTASTTVPAMGTWDQSTKTCTLTADTGVLQISSDQVTLDGAGFKIASLYVNDRTGVTIKNVSVTEGYPGLAIFNSSHTTLDHIQVYGLGYGVKLEQSPYTTITDADIHNNDVGLYVLGNSHHLTMHNVALSSNRLNLSFNPSELENGDLLDSIDTTNTTDGKIIYFFDHVADQTFDALPNAGVFFCVHCTNITLKNTTFGASHNEHAVTLEYVASSTVSGNTIKNATSYGIISGFSPGTVYSGNTISDNASGMGLFNSADAVVSGNTFSGSSESVMDLGNNPRLSIIGNTFESNRWGIAFAEPDTVMVQNNFVGNREDVSIGTRPTLSQALPVGGNYWSSNSRPGSECLDANTDGVCDVPYSVYNSSGQLVGTDAYPWVVRDGWKTYTPPPSGPKSSNILFLPGVEASRLYRAGRPDEATPEKLLWEPSSDQDLKDLSLTTDGKQAPLGGDVYTRDVLDEAYISKAGPNIYKSFLAQMEKMKSVDHSITDYSAVPYDWRLSLDDIINGGVKSGSNISYTSWTFSPYIRSELARLASSSPSGRVTIVAHSNGGLVAKALLADLASTSDPLLAKVDRVIFVASPQVGTPQAIIAGLHGYGQGIPAKMPIVLGENTARAFAKNSPAVYNLMPSKNYFTYVDTPVVTFGDGLSDWVARYGSVVHSGERLHTFLTDTYGRVESGDKNTDVPDAMRETLLGQSERMHDLLDNWVAPKGVEVVEIAGWGVPTTVSGVKYEKKKGSVVPVPTWTIDGDGTVVTPSALWMGGASTTRYWVDIGLYNKENKFTLPFGRDHAGILEIPQVYDFVSGIVTNSNLLLQKYFSTSTPPRTFEGARLIYGLHSPLTLNFYDDLGHHTGISTTTGLMEEQIPGTYYVAVGDTKYIFTDTTTPVHIFMDGYASGTFTFNIGQYSGDTETASTTFLDIPTATTTRVTMLVSSDIYSAGVMEIDLDGDGVVDIRLNPVVGGVVTYTPPVPVVPSPPATQSPTPVIFGGGPLWHATSSIPDVAPEEANITTSTSAIIQAPEVTETPAQPAQEIISNESSTTQVTISTSTRNNSMLAQAVTAGAPDFLTTPLVAFISLLLFGMVLYIFR